MPGASCSPAPARTSRTRTRCSIAAATSAIVYLPTYAQPALDDAAHAFYESQGFEVHPIDVSPIYRLNGSLGCLVNVLARD